MNTKAVRASFKQQLIQFTADPQWIIPSIVAPFLFTAVMLMMYPGTLTDVIGIVIFALAFAWQYLGTKRSAGAAA